MSDSPLPQPQSPVSVVLPTPNQAPPPAPAAPPKPSFDLPNPTLNAAPAAPPPMTMPSFAPPSAPPQSLPPQPLQPKMSAPAPMPAPPAPMQMSPPPGPPLSQPPSRPASPPPTTIVTSNAPAGGQPLQRSPLRFLPFIAIGLVLLGLVYFLYSTFIAGRNSTNTTDNGGQTQTSATLTYWGLWEPSPVLADVIATYEQAHPGIKIEYQQQSQKDYRERLQTAIASGRGPDIFRFHASWVPMLVRELNPMPDTTYTATQFSDTFYPVANEQLKVGSQYVGVPLMYDGLALLYNQEALQTANAQPPQTWADLKTLAQQLTIRSNGKIQRAGMAIGTASNVDNFSDIIGLLMLQNGADPTQPTSRAAIETLDFYTSFAKANGVWDETLPTSTIAFGRGEVAMILVPSWRIHEIQAANPNLKFGVAAAPQLPGKEISWATYWVEGVSAQSQHKKESWEFLKYMSSADTLRALYSSAKKQRAFGELYPRKDMASELSSDALVAPFLAGAPTATDWYLNSFTFDGQSALNDQLIKYYEDAVNSVVGGGDSKKAMDTVQQGTTQVLRQYNISTSASGGITNPAQ